MPEPPWSSSSGTISGSLAEAGSFLGPSDVARRKAAAAFEPRENGSGSSWNRGACSAARLTAARTSSSGPCHVPGGRISAAWERISARVPEKPSSAGVTSLPPFGSTGSAARASPPGINIATTPSAARTKHSLRFNGSPTSIGIVITQDTLCIYSQCSRTIGDAIGSPLPSTG